MKNKQVNKYSLPKALVTATHYDPITCSAKNFWCFFFQATFTDAVPPNDQTKILPPSLSGGRETDGGDADSEREKKIWFCFLLPPPPSTVARPARANKSPIQSH